MTDRQLDPAMREKIMEGFKTVPFARLLGMEIVDVAKGEATVKVTTREDLKQPYGLLHGGVTASLVDTATAFAVIAELGQAEQAATSNLTIHYLRPHVEGTIFCHAKVVKAGRKLLTLSAEVVNEAGQLIATSIVSYSKV